MKDGDQPVRIYDNSSDWQDPPLTWAERFACMGTALGLGFIAWVIMNLVAAGYGRATAWFGH